MWVGARAVHYQSRRQRYLVCSVRSGKWKLLKSAVRAQEVLGDDQRGHDRNVQLSLQGARR